MVELCVEKGRGRKFIFHSRKSLFTHFRVPHFCLAFSPNHPPCRRPSTSSSLDLHYPCHEPVRHPIIKYDKTGLIQPTELHKGKIELNYSQRNSTPNKLFWGHPHKSLCLVSHGLGFSNILVIIDWRKQVGQRNVYKSLYQFLGNRVTWSPDSPLVCEILFQSLVFNEYFLNL